MLSVARRSEESLGGAVLDELAEQADGTENDAEDGPDGRAGRDKFIAMGWPEGSDGAVEEVDDDQRFLVGERRPSSRFFR